MGEIIAANERGKESSSPIEEVRLTVPSGDDPTLPVWTFRMWSIGLLSCALMSFLNQFFSYRTEPLVVTQITVQVASLPMGHFLARVLPRRKFRPMLDGGRRGVEPQPGALQHQGARAHLHLRQRRLRLRQRPRLRRRDRRHHPRLLPPLHLLPRRLAPHHHHPGAWVRVGRAVAQVCGGAGEHVVASTLVQVSLFRALHEKEESPKGSRQISRSKFFLVALMCSFAWYIVPGYLFPTLTSISWVCWVFSKSVTAQQLGSGMKGLGLGAFTLDWSAVSSFLFSPLISPFFGTANIFVGYVCFLYVLVPTAYWWMNLYNAKTFPIFSSHLFMSNGSAYEITDIVNQQFQLDTDTYAKLGRINLSTFFALFYGLNFATIAATITHVGIFYGK
uniref:Oligopeptide transporter n=1 Tax=Hordeum vulgare subsp. vulgare TaxID=112509 RepID=A0A8I7BAF9_HORVV